MTRILYSADYELYLGENFLPENEVLIEPTIALLAACERIRIIDLAQRVIAATGSASDVEFVEYDRVYGHGIEDMLHRIPSIEKVSAAIDWRPERTLDEILADVIEHVRTAPALAEV